MAEPDHPPVVVRPPILFGGTLVLAFILEAVAPLGPGLGGGTGRTVAVGLSIAVLGGAIVAMAANRFSQAGTNLPTWEPTLALVETGPFRFSRNPIYIGLSLIYFGLATTLTSVWAMLFLPALIAVVHYGIVLREEAYLTDKFGATYTSYQARVPRWL
jgi:protein-S-isoprenylcysteine O-methyltransferase Ste14